MLPLLQIFPKYSYKEKLLTKADAMAIFATKQDMSEMKVALIQWMVGLLVAFAGLIITAVWAILSFAVK